MKNPFKRLLSFYWHYMVSPEKYARHIGVTIGKRPNLGSDRILLR